MKKHFGCLQVALWSKLQFVLAHLPYKGPLPLTLGLTKIHMGQL